MLTSPSSVSRSTFYAAGLLAVACSSAQSPGPAWTPAPPPPYPPPADAPAAPSHPAPPVAAEPAPEPAPAGSSSSLADLYAARPALQAFSGKATYYADSLAGNRTASGETYDPKVHSAAHRKLPFGTVVRVTRQDTGVATYVRVNDRGPFAGRDRVIDLSRAAAEELEMMRAGVVPVRVEVLELPPKKGK